MLSIYLYHIFSFFYQAEYYKHFLNYYICGNQCLFCINKLNNVINCLKQYDNILKSCFSFSLYREREFERKTGIIQGWMAEF